MFAVLATLLPSLTTAWISYLQNQRALTAKASGELLSVSGQAAREVDLWMKERRYDLRVFASSYEVTENLERMSRVGGQPARSGRAYERLNDYLGSVREKFAVYDELLVLDPQHQVVASSAGRPRAVALPADWDAELRRTDLVQGAPYWDSTAQRPEMLIAVPIRANTSRLLGALTARTNLQTVAGTLRRFRPGEAGRVYVMTEEGGLIVGSSDSSASLLQLKYPLDRARWLLAREGHAVQFGSLPGSERVLGVVRRIPSLGWVVVAEGRAAPQPDAAHPHRPARGRRSAGLLPQPPHRPAARPAHQRSRRGRCGEPRRRSAGGDGGRARVPDGSLQ